MNYSNYTRKQLQDLRAYLQQLIRTSTDEEMKKEYRDSIKEINEAMSSQNRPI